MSFTTKKLEQTQAQFTATLKELFLANPQRAQEYSAEGAGIFLDYSKNFWDHTIFNLFSEWAHERKLTAAIEQLFSQDYHPVLRREPVPQPMSQFVQAVQQKTWRGFTGKPITTIVNIGIGGSHQGPEMVYYALRAYWHADIRCHFVSNLDSAQIHEILAYCNPEQTLFIIASKSFSTEETLNNAEIAKKWLWQCLGNSEALAYHCVAVTAAPDKALAWGLPKTHIFTMGTWLSGRYSVWSAIGLSVAVGTRLEVFAELLHGAQAMDQHFQTTAWNKNLPVLLAFLGIWYRNFWNKSSYAVIPYAHHLKYWLAYLQQLDMESNGKWLSNSHQALGNHTAPIVWGEVGTNAQHAFFQSLHQGTDWVPCDFIVFAQSLDLLSQALAQAQTLMMGFCPEQENERYKQLPGNRPSTILLMKKLSPENLGALMALYEHKIFVQATLWDINPFDQWGVEQGKKVAKHIREQLRSQQPDCGWDTSTEWLIQKAHAML